MLCKCVAELFLSVITVVTAIYVSVPFLAVILTITIILHRQLYNLKFVDVLCSVFATEFLGVTSVRANQ